MIQNRNLKYLKFISIAVFLIIFLCFMTDSSKVDEIYMIDETSLPENIPVLVMEKKEILKGPLTIVEWDWRSNEISKGKEIPLYFKESTALLEYCRWDGNRLVLHSDLLDEVEMELDMIFDEYETVDGSLNVVFNHFQEDKYIIKCGEKEMQLKLPRLTHALAGKMWNDEGWLLILVESGSNKYEINYALQLLKFDLKNQDYQVIEIKNIPEQLTKFLESHVDWRNRAYDRINCYVNEKDVFLYDEKSVYRIDITEKNCKRIFHINNSIPENIVNQYPDIENSYINDMGYYQGMFILEIIRDNGSSRYWYIPFLKEPVIHEQDWEKQWYSESHFPNIS